MSLPVSESQGLATIFLRVQPRASRSAVVGPFDVGARRRLKVAVTAAPADGKANAAVIQLLARPLGVSKASLALVRGKTSRDKEVRVDGLSAEEVRQRLLNVG